MNHLDTFLDGLGDVWAAVRVGSLGGRVGVSAQRALWGVRHRCQGRGHPECGSNDCPFKLEVRILTFKSESQLLSPVSVVPMTVPALNFKSES